MDIKKMILTLIIVSMFIAGGCFYVGEGGSYSDTDFDGVVDYDDICNGFDDNLDDDADGVPDGCDQCPGFDDNEDLDGDGVIDGCATLPAGNDADGDGVDDSLDVCPGFDDLVDADGDTVPDGCDVCPGGDDNLDANANGIPDYCEALLDTDGDGTPDDQDTCTDTDGDGFGNPGFVVNTCPDDTCEGFDDHSDADTDTFPDGCDNCPSNPNIAQLNSDGDTHGDACDNCALVDNEDQLNSDTDGLGDVCDNCPTYDNPTQTNQDTDSYGDGCDNCALVDNEDQANGDGDLLGDACDYLTMAWSAEIVEDTVDVTYNSLVASDSNDIHISYYDGLNGYLKYAYYDGTSWTKSDVDTGSSVGMHNSIALDASNYPHIAYYDATNGGLKYAYYDGSSWQIETPMPVSTEGHISLALGQTENYITYYFDTGAQQNLGLLRGTFGSWTSESPDHLNNGVGKYNSMVFDEASSKLYVGYYDETNGDLKYAESTTPLIWIQDIVESGGVGTVTAMTLDSSGYPRIVYVDYTNYYSEQLKYTYFDGVAWALPVTLNGDVYPGTAQTDLAVDSSGNIYVINIGTSGEPYLNYYSVANNYWYPEMNLNAVVLGEDCDYISLDLDSSEKPHISYMGIDSVTGDKNLVYIRGE